MNTILKPQHAESFLALSHKGREIGNKVCQILTEIDAVKSVKRVRVTEEIAPPHTSIDQIMVKSAIYAVQFAESATTELIEVVAKRKMQITQEYKLLAFTAQELGTRLYRNLWEITLSPGDNKLLRALIKRIAAISVWEDLPATQTGMSYAHVKNGMNGTIAFEHAYGVTFMEYKNGTANNGWTVLRDTLEESLIHARYEMDYAVSFLTPDV